VTAMKHDIIADLADLAFPVSKLRNLPGNPNQGDVSAVAASLNEFGQHKPCVAKMGADGETATVLIGNHTLLAAIREGWTHVAVAFVDDDEARAIARALADNQTSRLSHDDPELLNAQLAFVAPAFPDLMTDLGWDDFTVAALAEVVVPTVAPYNPPQLVATPPPPVQTTQAQDGQEATQRFVAPEGADSTAVVQGGAAVAGIGGGNQVVQTTLVFDNTDQQRRWYGFLRWLKIDEGTDGETIAERIMDFVEAHADF
jgi:hypothetical protein